MKSSCQHWQEKILFTYINNRLVIVFEQKLFVNPHTTSEQTNAPG